MTGPVPEALLALAFVAIGGGIGSMLRFWVSGVVGRRYGETFPWGTLAVNLTGAAAIGVLAAVLLAPDGGTVLHRPAWEGLVIGVLGAYTTVSSFSLQTLALARNGEAGRAVANILLSIGLCLAAAAVTLLGTARLLAVWAGP